MDILILGGGGREHVLARALTVSEYTTHVYTAPGNAGTAQCGTNVPDLDITDSEAVAAFCRERLVDLCIIESQQALLSGVADKLRASGIWVIGPGSQGVKLESSKRFAKEFMQKHGIPTAEYVAYESLDEAHCYIDECAKEHQVFEPLVIKADGILAERSAVSAQAVRLPSGSCELMVFVVRSAQEAHDALESIAALHRGHDREHRGHDRDDFAVIIERYLVGKEYSLTVLTDGAHMVPLKMAGVYRHLNDGNTGPLSDGMGAYCPVLSISDEARQAIRELALKTVAGIKEDGISLRGMLTLDVMVANDGVYVLEYNMHCGSPQLQSIVPRMTSDPVEALVKCSEGRVNEVNIYWNNLKVVTVVLTAAGYPNHPAQIGEIIEGIDDAWALGRVNVYHEGTARTQEGAYVVADGRVLAITGLGDTFEEARERAYAAADRISFAGKHLRTDIGQDV